jgi:MFS family permease
VNRSPSITSPSRPVEARPAAGRAQATVLLGASCLSVLGAVLIAPVQPRIEDAFANTAGVDVLVPIILTVPALMIGLLAPFAGRIADRAGRVRLLTIALLVYAVFGTAPLWLPTLPLVVASRVGVGIAEAAIMTCCTTLLADLWSGPARDRVLGLQVVATSVSAIVFIGLGGALGANGWRTPFWIYAASLVFAVLVPRVLWNPAGLHRAAEVPPLQWRPLVAPVAMSFGGGIIFYAPIVELSFKLDDIGVTSTAVIGAVSAFAAIATAAGAVSFGRLAGQGTPVLLPGALALAGIGLVVLGAGSAVPLVALGAVICSAGCGLLLPTLLTWALTSLRLEERGRGTGIWTASLFIGQFICPLAVLALAAVLGGLSGALVVLGVVAILLAVVGRSVAGRSVAGGSVAERSVAGRSVAGGSVAERSVAGRG